MQQKPRSSRRPNDRRLKNSLPNQQALKNNAISDVAEPPPWYGMQPKFGSTSDGLVGKDYRIEDHDSLPK